MAQVTVVRHGLSKRAELCSLTGPDSLLKHLTKTGLETAPDWELTEHLDHKWNGNARPETGNVRSGTRPKMVLTEATGQVAIGVPGTRQDVRTAPRAQGQRRLTGVDGIVLSLYVRA